MVVMVFIFHSIWSFVHFNTIIIRTIVRALTHSIAPARPFARSFTRCHRAPSVKDSAILHTCAIYYVMCVSGEMRSYIHNDLSAVCTLCRAAAAAITRPHMCAVCTYVHACVRDRSASQPYVCAWVCVAHVSAHMPLSHTQQLFLSLSAHTHIVVSYFATLDRRTHPLSLAHTQTHTFFAVAAASLNFKIVCTLHIIISYFLAAINKLRFPHHTHNSISCFRTVELVQAVQCVFLIRLTNAFSFLFRSVIFLDNVTVLCCAVLCAVIWCVLAAFSFFLFAVPFARSLVLSIFISLLLQYTHFHSQHF